MQGEGVKGGETSGGLIGLFQDPEGVPVNLPTHTAIATASACRPQWRRHL